MGLLGDSLGPGQVAVAQAVHADAAGEIQILLALRALGIQPWPFSQCNGIAVIGVQDIFVVPLDDFSESIDIPSLVSVLALSVSHSLASSPKGEPIHLYYIARYNFQQALFLMAAAASIDVQLRTSEHRSMYSYVRLSIDRCTAVL